MRFTFSDTDLLFEVNSLKSLQCTSKEGSNFDSVLQEKWNQALEKGYFRYRLNITSSKVLPGKYSFIAQLNTDRATNRRAPEDITCLNQPFNADKFNFTVVKDHEILFKIARRAAEPEVNGDVNVVDSSKSGDYLVINVSPLEYCHSLLLPSLYDCLPQVVTVDSVKLAIETVLLSSSTALRVGFNSLCGFASVNHLHYHIYYLHHQMLLECIPVEHLAGPCYQLLDFPAQACVFQLPPDRNTTALARSVHRLTNFFQETNVAHNLYITRGVSFDKSKSNGSRSNYDTIRVYVWARTSSTGAKESAGFNPALCELFGHLNVKEETFYTDLTESQVLETLAAICGEPFRSNKENVIALFQS